VQLSRRAVLGALAAAAGSIVLAACGSAAPTAGSSPASSPPAASSPAAASPAASAVPAGASVAVASASAAAQPSAGAPKRGGTLRHGVANDITTLDGIQRGGNPYESVWLIYDRLVTYDDKLKPLPMLAESWDLTPDYTQIKLNLRKGATWHNGRELTSDDVKWNFLRVRDPKAGYGDFASQSAWFTSIDTPDKNTVVLKSDASRPAMFDLFQQFNMGDKNTLEGPEAKTKAIGTGPFVFKEWVQGDHITITRNPNYWQSGRPYLDSIVVSIRAGDQPGIVALEGGQIDLLRTDAYRDVARLKQDPKYPHPCRARPDDRQLLRGPRLDAGRSRAIRQPRGARPHGAPGRLGLGPALPQAAAGLGRGLDGAPCAAGLVVHPGKALDGLLELVLAHASLAGGIVQ
jgi:ABC-type transport system substrate-binding protein